MARTLRLEVQPGPTVAISGHQPCKLSSGQSSRRGETLCKKLCFPHAGKVDVVRVALYKPSGVNRTWLPALPCEKNKDIQEEWRCYDTAVHVPRTALGSFPRSRDSSLPRLGQVHWHLRSPTWGTSLLQQQKEIFLPETSVKAQAFHYLLPNLRALCPAPFHFTRRGTMLLLKFWDDQGSA